MEAKVDWLAPRGRLQLRHYADGTLDASKPGLFGIDDMIALLDALEATELRHLHYTEAIGRALVSVRRLLSSGEPARSDADEVQRLVAFRSRFLKDD
jgi:hypothetical protein